MPPSSETTRARSPTLRVQLQHTRDTVPTHGARATYPDSDVSPSPATTDDGLKGTSSLDVPQGRG